MGHMEESNIVLLVSFSARLGEVIDLCDLFNFVIC